MSRFATLLKGGVAAASLLGVIMGGPAMAGGTLRIAMTATDVPTTTGIPNNGFEGVRFLGFTAYDSLVAWDLSKADKPAEIVPSLAESWKQDPGDLTKWTFTLRKDVKFHDGSDFNADAVIWNFARSFDDKSKQFDAQGGAINRGRPTYLAPGGYRKVDDFTVEFTTTRPVSYFPYLVTTIFFASPAQFEKVGGSWAEFAKAPAGTGPFKITEFKPRISVEMARNADYWDKARIPKVDKLVLLPMAEASTRLAALRSGQVDWIEVPPPDAADSLKRAGYEIVTNSYPHMWPWSINLAKDGPWKDVRVRQAANYCVDRNGLGTLLSGFSEPMIGFFKKGDPNFGNPKNIYSFDPTKAKALLAEAGYGPAKPVKAKVMISTSGSGQMLPIPMNEFLQQSMKQCGFDITFEVVEWGTMLVGLRSDPMSPQGLGADAMNASLVSSDVSMMTRWFLGSNATPAGSNWSHWKNDAFDAAIKAIETATDPEVIKKQTRIAHEQLVDDPPWIWIVHDLNPRAMTKKVKGFVSAQSWFQDLTRVDLQ